MSLGSLLYPIYKTLKPELPHIFLPLLRLLQRDVCPWGNALLKWGLGAVTIAVFKPQVSALIKILSSLRVALNVAFLTGQHVQSPSFFSPAPLFVLCLSLCLSVLSLIPQLRSLKVIINYSQEIRATRGLCYGSLFFLC